MSGPVASQALVCAGLQVRASAHGPLLATVQAALAPGRLTAIVGPNGAGKSTLMAVMAGLRPPAAGRVCLGAEPLHRLPAAQLARRMAFMAQETQVAFAFSAQEVVEMGRYPHRQQPSHQEAQIVQSAMDSMGVAHLARREVTTLSGGERARVQLARVLAQLWQPHDLGSQWLLLDEPTAALDLQHQHQVMALLRIRAQTQGLGVVAVLHDLNLALRYAHEVLLVPGQGRAAELGAVADILTPDCMARVWGIHSEAVRMQDGALQYLFAPAPRPGAELCL